MPSRGKNSIRGNVGPGLVAPQHRSLWRGMIGLYIINEGQGPLLYNSSARRRRTASGTQVLNLIRTTGGSWSPTTHGMGVTTNGTDFRYESTSQLPAFAQIDWPISMMWCGDIASTPATNTMIAGITHSTANPRMNFGIGYDGTDLVVFYGGAASLRKVVLTGVPTSGSDYRLVVTRGAGTDGRYFWRGKDMGALTYGTGSLSYPTTARWQLGNGNIGSSGNSRARHSIFAIWNRRLTVGEGRALTLDPFSWVTPWYLTDAMAASLSGSSPISVDLPLISVATSLSDGLGIGHTLDPIAVSVSFPGDAMEVQLGSALQVDLPLISVSASLPGMAAAVAGGSLRSSNFAALRRRLRRG